MKKALHRGGFETLNVYSTTAGALPRLGLPAGAARLAPLLDGIVSTGSRCRTPRRRSRAGTTSARRSSHEAGHWFNLEHTFFGGCNAKGDFVDDTPPMRVPTSGCPEGKDTCSEPGLDPIHNYMDYSYDACYKEFTAGQVARMQDAWLFHRA